MGSLQSHASAGLGPHVLMLSVCGAGRSSLLDRIKNGRIGPTVPTVGFCCEAIRHRGASFTLWDVGGGWSHSRSLCNNVHGVVFVVDSSDRSLLPMARRVLENLSMDERLHDAFFLVLANKQDLPDAADVGEIFDELQLGRLCSRAWVALPCSALTGQGMGEAMRWLAARCKLRWRGIGDQKSKTGSFQGNRFPPLFLKVISLLGFKLFSHRQSELWAVKKKEKKEH
uniref:uncharacterized protein n=1 Tax=Myxine glutinosa TaxID=7769 RepID=UPI00358FAABC